MATRGKRALLEHAFHKEVQNKYDASMNIKRRSRSPKTQVNFFFIGLCWQVGTSVLGNGVGGHGTPWGCTSDTVLVTISQGMHLGAHAEGLAGGWPYSNWELPLLNHTQKLSLDASAAGIMWALHFNLFCFIWRSFEK